MDKDYNGWKNYDTHNVALWINNDPHLYALGKRSDSYADFVSKLPKMQYAKTPDGVPYWSTRIDLTALNNLIKELN